MEPLFVVDQEKCTRDGICAAECPLKIIEIQDDQGIPGPALNAEELCINCGHCVAVCPHGALAHRNMGPEDCLPVKKERMLPVDHAEHFLRYRRSIRTYKDQPVEREKIEKLITLSSYAPSGHNSQSIQWQVIEGKEKVRELSAHVIDWMSAVLEKEPEIGKMMHFDMKVAQWESGVDTICKGCAALVLTNGGAQDPFVDASSKIALTYFELAAPSLKLGSCWNGYFTRAAMMWKPLKAALGMPEDMANYGSLMLGYPKFRYSRMPARNTPNISWG